MIHDAATDAAFAEQYVLCLQVPDEVLHDAALNAAIAVLPANYNFEVRSSTCSPRAACMRLKWEGVCITAHCWCRGGMSDVLFADSILLLCW